MTRASRRNFLKTSAVGAAALASTQALAQGQTPSKKMVAEFRSLEAREIQATTTNWDDGLAHPIPYKNPPWCWQR